MKKGVIMSKPMLKLLVPVAELEAVLDAILYSLYDGKIGVDDASSQIDALIEPQKKRAAAVRREAKVNFVKEQGLFDVLAQKKWDRYSPEYAVLLNRIRLTFHYSQKTYHEDIMGGFKHIYNEINNIKTSQR